MQTHHGPRSAARSQIAFPAAEAPLFETPERFAQVRVVACSLCLRVLRNTGWIEAEAAIRELRSYELPSPVVLDPGLCDSCVETIRGRRSAPAGALDQAVA